MSDTGALVYVADDGASAQEAVADLVCSAGLMAQAFEAAEELLAAPRLKKAACLVLDWLRTGSQGPVRSCISEFASQPGTHETGWTA